jgi:hypothetical protein
VIELDRGSASEPFPVRLVPDRSDADWGGPERAAGPARIGGPVPLRV